MKNILITFLLFFTLSIKAQDTIITKVIVFDQDDMSKYDSNKEEYGKNAIKLNPLLIVNGEIPIYYERALSKSLAAEGAIGITYKDYAGNLFDDGDNSYGDSETEQVHPNLSLKAGLRYYTGGVALDGFYFAVEFAYRKYAITKELTTSNYNNSSQFNTSSTIFLKEEKTLNEFKLIIGSQSHSYWDNFFIDYYGGVGIRNTDKIAIDDVQDSSGYTTYQLIKRKTSGPAIYLGLKFGFEF